MRPAIPNLAAAGVAAAGAVAVVRRPWLHSGTTAAERRRTLPGDEFVRDARLTATRATTIAATPAQVWPWLLQMGHGRAGWYGFDLWDNAGVPSASQLVGDLQHLEVGAVIADAMGPFGFRVVRLDDERALVFRATIHPITGKPADPAGPAPYMDFTWAFVLEPCARGTRLLVRVRYDHSPSAWVTAAVEAYELVDAVFTRKMLAGIRARAEQPAPDGASRRVGPRGARRTGVAGQGSSARPGPAVGPGAVAATLPGSVTWRGHAATAASRPPRTVPTGGGAMEARRRTRVSEIMTRHPVLLREDEPVDLGGLALLHHGISAAPVVDEYDRLVGVFSQSDVLARFAAPRQRRGPVARLDDRHARARTVGEACTRPPGTIPPDATVDTAARELLDRDIGRLVVVEGREVVGIVSRSDLLKLLLPSQDEPGEPGEAGPGEAAASRADAARRRLSYMEPD